MPQLSALFQADSGEIIPILHTTVARNPSRILADSGALRIHAVASLAWAKQTNLTINRYSSPKPIRLPNNTVVYQEFYAANVPLQLGAITTTFAHVPLLTAFNSAFDFILGSSWLSKHRALLDFSDHSLTYYHMGRRTTIPFAGSSTFRPHVAPMRVGRKALRKITKHKDAQMFLCLLQPARRSEAAPAMPSTNDTTSLNSLHDTETTMDPMLNAFTSADGSAQPDTIAKTKSLRRDRD